MRILVLPKIYYFWSFVYAINGNVLEIAEEKLKKIKTIKILLIIFAVTMIYAVLRYNVFKGVPWSELPLYVSNKAIAWTSLVSICLSYLSGLMQKAGKRLFTGFVHLRKYLGMYGFFLAIVHIMITLSILTVENYPSLYDGIAINSKGELVIMFGMLCLCCIIMPAVTSVKAVREGIATEKWKLIQQLGYGALLANIFHVFSMGSNNWIEPGNWYGYMPPITMIAASIALVTLLLKLYTILLNKK